MQVCPLPGKIRDKLFSLANLSYNKAMRDGSGDGFLTTDVSVMRWLNHGVIFFASTLTIATEA